MFKEKCFTKEWLQSFKRQAAHRRIDVIILEKMIYALHLLEQLHQHGLNFTFKGGTSLVLLLEDGCSSFKEKYVVGYKINCTFAYRLKN